VAVNKHYASRARPRLCSWSLICSPPRSLSTILEPLPTTGSVCGTGGQWACGKVRLCPPIVGTFVGYWTTRGYANSQIANSRTGRLVDWTSRGLDNSQMPSETLRA